MTLCELGILIVYYLKLNFGCDVALLVRADNRQPESWASAGEGGRQRAATACVQLMQAQAERGYAPTDYYLFTTEHPSAMCLGMAKRCHVAAVIFLDEGKIKFNTWKDIGSAPRPLTEEMAEMIAGLWVQEAPWHDLHVYLQKKGVPGIANAITTGNAGAFGIWLTALNKVREVSFVWLTLPHNRHLQPVAAPRFRGILQRRTCERRHSPLRDKIYMTLAFALLDCARRGKNSTVESLSGQQIAAVLVGPDGRILSWGVNTNEKNVTRHGETNCVQTYFLQTGQSIPDGAILYTTLQSCEMCAGMLTTVARNLRVVYGAPDRSLGNTALQHKLNGCWEERFAGSESNPVARANFQRLVALRMQKEYHNKVQNAGRASEEWYRVNFPQASLASTATQEEKRQAGMEYRQSVTAFRGRAEALYRILNPSMFTTMNTRPLPNAITNALSSAPSMKSIAGYRRLYLDLGMMLLARRQFRPGRDMMGFTFTELEEIVRREELQRPILRSMTDSDWDAWKDGEELLKQVQQSALMD